MKAVGPGPSHGFDVLYLWMKVAFGKFVVYNKLIQSTQTTLSFKVPDRLVCLSHSRFQTHSRSQTDRSLKAILEARLFLSV